MIAHICGEVSDKNPGKLVIDVNGLGYEVHVTASTQDSVNIGQIVKLHTYFAVRENAQDLYGFESPESKRLFELLLGVSGVGPKVAMSITGLGAPGEVKSAIAGGNVAFVMSANGVGKRGAEKVIVELRDKVGAIGDDSFVIDNLTASDDAIEALVALGYSRQQAVQSLSKIDSTLPPEVRIAQALKEFGS